MQHSRRTWPAALPIPPFAGLLVLANAAAFVVAGSAVAPTFQSLALVPAELVQRPWSAVTYAFLHPSSWQLMLDMVALVLVAPRFESRMGGPALIGWYVGGALLALPLGFLAPDAAFAGSSAAVLAVLVGFAHKCPEGAAARPLPSHGQWLIPLLVGIPLLPHIGTPASAPVAIAHLSMAVLVGLYVIRPSKPVPVRQLEMPNSHYNAPGIPSEPAGTPWGAIDLEALHEVNRDAVIGVLDKARDLGPSRLTPSEREFLDRMCAASQVNSASRWG